MGTAAVGVSQSIALLAPHLPRHAAVLFSLMTATVAGAGFGILVWKQRFGAGEMLLWGMAYGILEWLLVPLTLFPLLTGGRFAWSVEAAQAAIAGLFEYLLSGATTALALAALRRDSGGHDAGPVHARLLRGAAAGAAAMWILALILRSQGRSLAFMAAMKAGTPSGLAPGVLLLGVVGGAGFSLFYPAPGGTGPGLIRGTMYGFFCWVAGGLTLVPLLAGTGVAWSLEAVRAHFVILPGYMLAGAAVALVYQWITAAVKVLFSEDVADLAEEGLAARGMVLVGLGALAGVVGGLLFTIIMLRIDELPTVARLIGASSPWTGFTVHLAIAEIVGASYGLLFARQSHDLGSAVGWGVSYGFFWWILGPLTLAPMLLGLAPRWTAPAAAALLPSLVGHLAYGGGLGVTFHLLEARHSPWWIPRTEMEETAAARRREQVLTSAPVLWALTVTIALTLPILLA
jgi:hypothetical protein